MFSWSFLQEEKLKQIDPKKAAQAERLGMGGFTSSKPGISHSVITEIASIEQVGHQQDAGTGLTPLPQSLVVCQATSSAFLPSANDQKE